MVKFENEIYAYVLENALLYEKAIESAVLPKLFQHGLEKQDINVVMPRIKEIVKEVNSFSEEKRNSMFEKYKEYIKEKQKQEEGLKELPNVKAKPIFRMAPFPSGTLHIGNMKTYLLNALYAEKYKGKTLLVIDDTIGSEEKQITPEAYKLIPEAFNFLKVKYSKPILYKSDRLKIYYEYAEKMIQSENAYVCSCSQEKLRENRIKQVECGCRIYPVKEQMKRWKKMFKAKQGSYILRIKTSMTYPDPAFRDRVLFRISDRKHPRVGKKYSVWPMLEFSWAIDDHLLNITHIIRGKELMIEGKMQKYIWDIFKWKHPELIYVGLVQLEGIKGKLSKSKSQKEVKSGEYIGWNDPRTWSVQSLEQRGILAESLREFVEKIGLNQNEISIPVDELYAINRKHLDKNADRYYFVENPIMISLDILPVGEIEVKIHPEKDKTRKIKLNKEIFVQNSDFKELENKEVRLMHLCNILLTKKARYTSSENKPELRKIHWVSDGVKTRIMMPDGAYSFGIAESAVKKLKPGAIIQFERFGFCRFKGIDKKTKELEFWFAHN
ncbi:glutamate--tRNA ligase [Candidatus Pacearchaeota archaeon]|nr:glutamate--tRNA ligase [Candidatus Pacearchaeota archaeon]